MLKETTLKSKYIKYEIVENERIKYINNLGEEKEEEKRVLESSKEGRVLLQETLEGNAKKSYKLRIWMDEETPAIEETMNQIFKSKIVIQGVIPKIVNRDMTIAYTINKEESEEPFPVKGSGYKAKEVVCENGVKAEWDQENWGIKIKENPKHERAIRCNIDFEVTLANYVIGKSEYEEEVIKQSHEETDQTGKSATTDYRYVGKDPNNYVCLKSEGTCSEDELYRIVGVMPTEGEDGTYENRVKLVKHTQYVEKVSWSGTSVINHNWTKSTLNTTILNQTYWESINEYQKYIDKVKWYLGEGRVNPTDQITKAEDIYKGERSNTSAPSDSSTIFTTTNIGLIYASDFGFATSGSDTTPRDFCLSKGLIQPDEESWLTYTECAINDWFYYGKSGSLYRWTITPSLASMSFTYGGGTRLSNDGVNKSHWISPSFYLKPNVLYEKGTGTKDNPYYVSIEK